MIKHSNSARLLQWYCDNHYHGSNLRMHGNTVCDMFWYWFYHFKWANRIVMDFRRWLGEDFTSDDVLLPNIVLFLGCTSLETWHIWLWITKSHMISINRAINIMTLYSHTTHGGCPWLNCIFLWLNRVYKRMWMFSQHDWYGEINNYTMKYKCRINGLNTYELFVRHTSATV